MKNVRLLTPEDALQLMTLRLAALRSEDHAFFTADPAAESRQNLNDWRLAAVENSAQAYFGAFLDDRLVSMGRARKWEKDTSGKTAYWGSDYTLPVYRHNPSAARLYHLRVKWCVEKGFDRAVFTIHPENARAIALHTKRGAVVVDKEPMRFANGQTVPALWFEKSLLPCGAELGTQLPASQELAMAERAKSALQLMQATYDSLIDTSADTLLANQTVSPRVVLR
jgi:GNAT superfamily N-acetyltransferase